MYVNNIIHVSGIIKHISEGITLCLSSETLLTEMVHHIKMHISLHWIICNIQDQYYSWTENDC